MHPVIQKIREGEHQRQDFKFRVDDARKIAITLVAFANTDGGRLLIGVKDNGKIAGVHSAEEWHVIEGAADLYCDPPVELEAHRWEVDGKEVLEVEVRPRGRKVHKAQDKDGRWWAYLRRNDRNLKAHIVQIAQWQEDVRPRGSLIELQPEEKRVLEVLREGDLTLNQIQRAVGMPRRALVSYLAHLMRWGLIELDYNGEQPHQWYFRLIQSHSGANSESEHQ